MDSRRDYFEKLHQDLAEKYRLNPDIVRFVRSFAIGQGWTKDEMIANLTEHITQKTITQERYLQVLKKFEYKISIGKQVNSRKFEKIKTSLANLNKNLTYTHTTLDTLLRISPETWEGLLVKTQEDK